MNFLADENLSLRMVEALRALGHDVASVQASARGSTDEQVLTLAAAENRVLITADKGFGELAFRRSLPAAPGIILLRVRGSAQARVAAVVAAVDARDDWAGQFSVIEDDRIRMTTLPNVE